MWLVQCSENSFVDAERIDWIDINSDGVVRYGVTTSENPSVVGHKYNLSFLNNVQALNGNKAFSIERAYRNIMDLPSDV